MSIAAPTTTRTTGIERFARVAGGRAVVCGYYTRGKPAALERLKARVKEYGADKAPQKENMIPDYMQ